MLVLIMVALGSRVIFSFEWIKERIKNNKIRFLASCWVLLLFAVSINHYSTYSVRVHSSKLPSEALIGDKIPVVIFFNPSQEMEVGESVELRASIALRALQERIYSEFRGKVDENDEIEKADANLDSEFVSMSLRSSEQNFEITLVTSEKLKLKSDQAIEWVWNVRALEWGNHPVYLTVYSHIRGNGENIEQTIKSLQRKIEVKVSYPRFIKNFIFDNLKWVLGALAGLVVWILGFKFKDEKQESLSDKLRKKFSQMRNK